METIRNLFAKHSFSTELTLFGGLITFLWLAELFFAGDSLIKKWNHTRFNFLFVFTALPIQLFLTVFILGTSRWASAHHWGLLYLFPRPSSILVKYIIGFILLDLCDYIYHVTMHKTGWLWKFHLVHHSDHKVDVSTTVREHPGETFVRECFLGVFVFLTGASIGVLLLRQLAQTVSNISSHMEQRLPARLDRILGWIFITPNLHQVHHHYMRPHTDCNYGDVFSVWDRVFGTYAELPSSLTRYGIDTHMDETANGKFGHVMAIPFLRKPPRSRMPLR